MKKIGYIYSSKVSKLYHDRLPSNSGRSSIVHELIESSGFFDFLDVVPPKPATTQELLEYHSTEYLMILSRIAKGCIHDIPDLEKFGLIDDCPIFDELVPHIRFTAGGSLTAASMLSRDEHDVVIHWDGGRFHHAQRSKASGFCYVNDIVLAIQSLRLVFPRILYLDLDIHHGDGVESAFAFSTSVYTLSLHYAELGYFPTTGSEYSAHTIPIPKHMYHDLAYQAILDACLPSVLQLWHPNVVVLQCGADALKGDPVGQIGRLSEQAYIYALDCIREHAPDAKLLILGGGGYHHANTARLWAHLTSHILQQPLQSSISTEYPFADLFGPFFDFELEKPLHLDSALQDWEDTLKIIRKMFLLNPEPLES